MNAGNPIAVLPMYDFEHVRRQTDAFWTRIRDNLRHSGIEAPQSLDRSIDRMTAWKSNRLVLGQTCGLPFMEHLRDDVVLVGTPDYGVPGCPPGWYRSAIVVRRDDPRETLPDFQGATLARNGPDSQSGWQAMLQALDSAGAAWPFFGDVVTSGLHAASIEMVVSGEADFAAIDFVSWRLAGQCLPVSRDLRVLDLTSPMPGLPFITRGGASRTTIAEAVERAIDELPNDVRDALGIRGFWHSTPADYEIIARERRTVE